MTFTADCYRLFIIALGVGVMASSNPSHAGSPSDTLLDRASRELTFYNFDMAYSLFGDALDEADEGGEAWQEAMFGRALAAQHRTPASRELISEATAAYQAIAERAPDSRFAPRSVLNLGRIAEIRDYLGDEVDLEAARTRYRQVFENWPDRDIADQAALFYACAYFQKFEDLDGVRTGLEFLEGWITVRDDRPGASMAWEVMGQVRYHHLRDYSGTVRCFIKADDLGLTDPNGAGVMYWHLGQVAQNELDDLPTAIHYYKKIITDAPRSGRAFHAQLALEELQYNHPDLDISIPEVQLFLAKPEEQSNHESESPDTTGGKP